MPFETTKNIKEEEEQEKAKVATKSPQASAWASGDAADDSDWSEDEPETDSIKTDESNFDFEDLLKRRDEAMFGSNDKSKAQKEQEANPIPFNISQLPTTSFNNTNKAFNALHLEVTEEPYEDYVKENDFSHENELLKQYIQQEEEEKSSDFESLRQLLGSKREAKSNSSTGESVSSESYERTPAHQRQFLRFQKRISRCPLQCMRYDYGGEPLWPTNVPRNLKIPKCKCGQDRVFEIQLIPTINYFLKVDDYVTGTIQINGTSVKKTGMDWASILVYSCPSSCERSNEEFIYVVPPINT
jgi:pre-rRNA-processing protein TSR4